MTLAKFPWQIIKMPCLTKLGVGGGDVLSIDTSEQGTTVQCVPVQEEGTTAGQDDILLGVSLTGTVIEGKALGTSQQVSIITAGKCMVRVANNNGGWNAGEPLFAQTDTQTVRDALFEYPDKQTVASIKCGVANKITMATMASLDAAKHLANDYERARYIGIALQDQANISGSPEDDARTAVLLRLRGRFVYATS